jgi:hypothetical protein
MNKNRYYSKFLLWHSIFYNVPYISCWSGSIYCRKYVIWQQSQFLKGLSRQIRNAWKLYLSKALGLGHFTPDLKYFCNSLLMGSLKFLSILHQTHPIIFLIGMWIVFRLNTSNILQLVGPVWCIFFVSRGLLH